MSDAQQPDSLGPFMPGLHVSIAKNAPVTASKYAQLATVTKEYRIRGAVIIVDLDYKDDELQKKRSQMWQALSDETRSMFEWSTPGTTKPSHENLGDLDKYEPQPLSPKIPSGNFVLLLLKPIQCDYLVLPPAVPDKSKPIHRESILQPARKQTRWLHCFDEKANKWVTRQLNP